jgi:hypothetical protein
MSECQTKRISRLHGCGQLSNFKAQEIYERKSTFRKKMNKHISEFKAQLAPRSGNLLLDVWTHGLIYQNHYLLKMKSENEESLTA